MIVKRLSAKTENLLSVTHASLMTLQTSATLHDEGDLAIMQDGDGKGNIKAIILIRKITILHVQYIFHNKYIL